MKKNEKIQINRRNKFIDSMNAIKKQNTIRKKYGLRPLKRLDWETFLYFLNDDEQQQRPQYVNPKYDGGMYQ